MSIRVPQGDRAVVVELRPLSAGNATTDSIDLLTYPDVALQVVLGTGADAPSAVTVAWQVANVDADAAFVALTANAVGAIGDVSVYGKGLVQLPAGPRYARAVVTHTGGRLAIVAVCKRHS